MGNTSTKRRNKNLWTGGIIALLALLVISFITSKKGSEIDPATIANVETFEVTAHEKGNMESEIRLVEYSDFQCPACKAAAPQIAGLVDQFGEQFVLEYRHFPLRSIHPNAQLAAQATEAAAIQGKFWEMHDVLFEKQNEWSQSFNPKRYFAGYAETIGINVDRFNFDLESDEVKQRVDNNADEASELQLPGTPAFVFNGEQIDLGDFITNELGVDLEALAAEAQAQAENTDSEEESA